MTSENTDSKQPSVTKGIYRFLGGAALGAFVAAIPVFYGASIDLNLAQVGIASALILSCGFLSIAWGEKFIDIVARTLNSFAS
jgi:ribosome biogenesis protein Tsr3